MINNPTPKRASPSYYACPCGGCVVTRETYFSMINDERLRCPGCNQRWHMFASVAIEDEPQTNEIHVDDRNDLIVHVQGEERGNHENERNN